MRYSWADARRLTYKERPEAFHWRPYRHMALPVVFLFANLRVSASAVTVVGGVAGLAGVWMVAFGPNIVPRMVTAALLLQAWVLSDFVDGGVARLRGKVSSIGTYLDAAIHHFIVARLVLPFVAIGLWLEGHGRIYVAVAFAYLLRAWYVRWHDHEMDRLVAKRAGLPPPVTLRMPGGNWTTGFAGFAANLLSYANDFVGLALGAGLAFLLEAVGVVPSGWARGAWSVGLTAALLTASGVGMARGVTPRGLAGREARLHARFQEHQRVAREKGLI